MRHLQVGVLAAAVTLGASWLGAQEGKKEAAGAFKCCGQTMHQLFCTTDSEKCESDKCKAVCEKAGVTLKAVGVKMTEMAKKEWGDKACEGCQKSETKPCEKCRQFCMDVVIPQVKERIASRTKDASIKHSVKNAEGKTEETPCTFLSGSAGSSCSPCVHEISDKSFAKLKELKASKPASGSK